MAHSNSKKKVKVYNTKKKRVPESKIIQELQSRYSSIDETNATNFSDLPLSSKTLKGLKEHNYVTMTDIQKQSIGLALKGHDILGAAKTGSGKTLAFLIPILEVLYCQQWSRLDGIGALVITPTRELAYQIYETLLKVGHYHDVSAGLIIGGKDLHFEKKRMDQCNIIICTPGRLLQHMDENPLFDCINLKILVLDEADRCLDMGFEKTMNGIIENLPPKRHTLLFSATQTRSVRDLARLSLKDPLYVSVHEHATHSTPEGLQQSYVVCNLEDKMAMLWSFLKNHLKQKIIVFFSSCKQVKYTYEVLCRMRPGVSLLALYGTLHQLKRMSIYESFCKKQHAVLFATDIAARGLDFPAVNWVVQMDCPEDVNAYIHRAGRTARFQRGGESLLVLLPSELEMVSQLEERKIPISLIKINPNRLFSPHRKLEALLARDVSLKETAQRAFVAYVKSVFLMKDKRIFKVNELNTDDYARSLGLAIPPRIRFLQRMQKKEGVQNKLETEKDKESTASNDSEDNSVELRGRTREEESDGSEECEESEENNKSAKTSFFDEAFSDDSDNDDGFLKIKRKNIDIDAELPNQELEDIDLNSGKKKAVTKAAIAKKILRKKIVPNTKVVFDEEGERVVDPAKLKVSALAQEYEKEVASGINIEMAKQILREEDRYDKQRFREKIKEKHREEKRKLKAAKKKLNDEQESDENSEDEETIANDYDMSYGDGDGDETDTPSLPDFNEDYSKQESSESEEDETEEDEQEEQVHRPSKRQLKTRKKDEGTKKKRKSSITSEVNLHADEELALQLLKN